MLWNRHDSEAMDGLEAYMGLGLGLSQSIVLQPRGNSVGFDDKRPKRVNRKEVTETMLASPLAHNEPAFSWPTRFIFGMVILRYWPTSKSKH